MSADHADRRAREDHRNEALARTRALQEYEQMVRRRHHERLVSVLIQRPEPHHFHECPVTPISPRRGWGWPAPPGGLDDTGFAPDCIV